MRTENRKAVRHRVRHGARLITADGAAADCWMLDLSATGAKLAVQAPDSLPDVFTLLLSHTGDLRRRCSVVWRSEHAVGVQFLPDCPVTKRRR